MQCWTRSRPVCSFHPPSQWASTIDLAKIAFIHQNPDARNRLFNFLLFSLLSFLVLLSSPRISLVAADARDDSTSIARPAQTEATGEDQTPSQRKDRPELGNKDLLCLILRDQKFLWFRPFQLKQADLPWAGAIGGSTAGLIAIDRRGSPEESCGIPGIWVSFCPPRAKNSRHPMC